MRRFRFSTRDAAEAADFIRQMYLGNHTRFGRDRGDAELSATVGAAEGIAASSLYPPGIPLKTAEFDLDAQILPLPLARLAAVGRQWHSFLNLAAAFIHAHADQPVTSGEIAAAAGVSARPYPAYLTG